MNRALVGFLIFVTLSSTALAKTVTVRSGEHTTFTRLVIDLPEKSEWRITKGLRQATVSISLSGLKFDTSEVFGRIPKTRLNALFQPSAESSLVLELGCDCDVVGFIDSDSLLVIDVSDRQSAKEATSAPLVLPINQQPYRYNLASSNLPPGLKKPLVLPTVSNPGGGTSAAPPKAISREPGGTRDTVMNLSERRLLEQIGRASDQDLLTPLVARLSDEPQNKPVEDVRDNVSGEGAIHPSIRVSAVTVVDRDMSRVSSALHHLDSKQECLPSAVIALPEWGEPRSFSDQIGRQRSDLYGEFDKVNSEAVLKLAKTYLYFGFGTEAKAVLELDPTVFSQQSVLIDLASLLDSLQDARTSAFAGQQNCVSDVSLWAVLAEPKNARNANTESVQQAFARLPKHLRVQLGPKLSRVFTQIGKTELASSILRAIDRTEENLGPSLELATAVLLQSQGNQVDAAEKMEDVVASDSESSPTAIIELTEIHLRERNPVSSEFPELVGAYAQEFRDDPNGAELRRAHSISLALAGQFDASFTALRRIEDGGDKNEVKSTIIPILSLLTENADNVVFLKHGLWLTQRQTVKLPDALKEKIARRALDLGFPEAALGIASVKGSQPTSLNLRFLKAEAAIELGLPHQALVELLNLSGPEAGNLRALAMRQNGDFQIAGRAFLDAQLIDEATRYFWLADSLSEVPEASDSHYTRIVEISKNLKREPSVPSDLTPLASARALLNESEATRGEINDLLVNVTITSDDQ